jgi:hypothetical protein
VLSRRSALRALACALALGGSLRAVADQPNLTVEGTPVHLDVTASDFTGGTTLIGDWVRRSANIVARYYARFPAKELWLRIRSMPGAGVQGGRTFADPDARIEVRVGREVTAAQLVNDWVLVHEMTHLALPDSGEEHAWLSEGIATYVEGVARVQAGNRTELDVWEEELRQMPRGMPQPGDAGLDHTHTWGRTYWGGAMFCLLADVDIRQRTQLKLGLQDALRAVLRASGGLSADWPIERVLQTGDAAVGTHSLEELYARTKDTPFAPDLPALWQRLGVKSDGTSVTLTDDAPLSAVRHAIMRPPAL